MSHLQQRLKALFHAATELPAEDRDAFLASRCDDAELRREVDRLLAAHDRAGDFLEEPGGLKAAASLAADGSPLVGQRFGSYRLLREIGSGGMGAVYLGTRDDAEYRKDVAIKIIRRDAATDLNLRRFRQERQILADLDHPNIARLLDAGTTEERIPYLVMELVDGVPVDAYAEQRNLSLDARLALFEQVCRAVAHAHQRGIVHRDLKPTNILVTSSGSVKLLDFGIAKLLEADGGPLPSTTTTLGRMLTPEYASPEQVRGESVTIASDIYSLGVLLYRLLSGGSPYHAAADAPHELARAICEQDAPSLMRARLSSKDGVGQLRSRAGRDIDAIIGTAMRKRPEDRYSSIEALAEAVRRYRAGLPVRARRLTSLDRSTRFVRQHRAGAAVALVVAPALVFAAVWSGELARPPDGRDPVRPLTVALLPLDNAASDPPRITSPTD